MRVIMRRFRIKKKYDMDIIKTLNQAKLKYDIEIQKVHKKLSEKILFDFSIEYQPSDGFVLVADNINDNAPYNTPIEKAVRVISEKGVFNLRDAAEVSI